MGGEKCFEPTPMKTERCCLQQLGVKQMNQPEEQDSPGRVPRWPMRSRVFNCFGR